MANRERSRRTLWVVLAIASVPLMFALLVGFGVYDALRPDAPAPDLRTRTPRTLQARTDGRSLDTRSGCGVVVQAVTAGNTPIDAVTVEVRPQDARDGVWSVVEEGGPAGVISLEDIPCGDVLVQGDHPDLGGPGPAELRLAPGERPDLVLLFLPAVEVTGTVLDPRGNPVAEAAVRLEDDGESVAYTNASGQYSHQVRVPLLERSILSLNADALGYHPQHERRWLVRDDIAPPEPELEPDTGSPPARGFGRMQFEEVEVAAGDRLTIDFTLDPFREVRVWCAGLPDDLCNDMLVQCTHPLVPMGDGCSHDERTGETICDCNGVDGAAAIRGGGKATLVQEGDDEAWLDFRDAGTLTGRVMAGGQPVTKCDVATLRVPNGLEDLPRGIIAAQRGECDVEGRFEIHGVVEGDWELVVEADVQGMGSTMRVLDPTRVRARKTTDVGEVEMLAGGGIEGRVTDGLTGEPRSGAPILAIKHGEGSARSTPFFADIDMDGTFRFEGLPPGEWELSYFLTPHVSTTVTVDDGAITDGVEVETSDATALETNGFSLGVEDGHLAIQEVEPGSPADDAGLLEGDSVEGVLVAGLDIGSHLGEHADQFMQLVLGHWDGPGVTLLVERDGEELEVELDW